MASRQIEEVNQRDFQNGNSTELELVLEACFDLPVAQ